MLFPARQRIITRLRPATERSSKSMRRCTKRSVPKGRLWYLLYRPAAQDDPAFAAFRSWLMAAAHGPARAGR